MWTVITIAIIISAIVRGFSQNGKSKKNNDNAFYSGGGFSTNTILKKLLIEERGACCEDCGSVEKLIVHHVLPVSMGGSDNLDNLKLLCYECHLKQHHHHFDETGNGYRKVSKKALDILQAIDEEKIMTIHYRKPIFKNGRSTGEFTITKRDIKPLEYYREDGNYYLKAFCYLRNEERVFKVARIDRYKVKN